MLKVFLDKIPVETVDIEEESPRGRILAAALKLFAEKGADASSTREIAQLADVNQAMINYYFGNKEKLYQQVVMTQFFMLFKALAARVDTAWSAGEFIPRFPLILIEVLRENPDWSRVILRELASGSPRVTMLIKTMGISGPKGLRELLTWQINNAQGDGVIRELPVNSILYFLIALSYGTVFVQPLIGEAFQDDLLDSEIWESHKKVFSEILLHGIATEREG
ncbi:TetR family transcriptional regulator [bacterium]|nr:TetR family transcriptional regulator [bacterium]